ncbi:hypothetical protein [Magnetococcus sp. PR-3]|uniref:hypothetical protein n=1 Tax=Magnetococcus sp. PR-3 TaxID=3120355 RepID=UPI002FCE5436
MAPPMGKPQRKRVYYSHMAQEVAVALLLPARHGLSFGPAHGQAPAQTRAHRRCCGEVSNGAQRAPSGGVSLMDQGLERPG